MFCKSCGQQMDDFALACPKCGAASTTQAPPPTQQYQPPAYQQYQQQPPVYQQPYQYQQENSNPVQNDLSMFGWYRAVLKKYADFSGRARRKEFWMFYLCNMLIMFILYIFYFIGYTRLMDYDEPGALFYLSSILLGLYGLGIFIPNLAVMVRRLHDIGKSGGWFFISFIPFVGGIWFLVLMVTAGTVGPNQYGNDPKGYLNNNFASY